MKKTQWGKLIYLLAILLVIYFGFLRPAMQISDQPANLQTEATEQVATNEGTVQERVEIATEQVATDEEAEQAEKSDSEENVQEAENIDSSAVVEIPKTDDTQNNMVSETSIEENGYYSSKNEVAFYLHTYGHLPSNYITKDEASELGWSKGNTLDKVAPGMSIGGDKFGNREGLLPKQDGRQYYECDIDYEKGGRNAKRIVYSNDGLIFYTEDHYETFEQLY